MALRERAIERCREAERSLNKNDPRAALEAAREGVRLAEAWQLRVPMDHDAAIALCDARWWEGRARELLGDSEGAIRAFARRIRSDRPGRAGAHPDAPPLAGAANCPRGAHRGEPGGGEGARGFGDPLRGSRRWPPPALRPLRRPGVRSMGVAVDARASPASPAAPVDGASPPPGGAYDPRAASGLRARLDAPDPAGSHRTTRRGKRWLARRVLSASSLRRASCGST